MSGIEERVQRFERRAESIATLLQRQLEAVGSFHDLSRRQLRASHRSVLKLTRGGSVPTPQEFWQQTAQPQARNLFDAVCTSVDSEAAELTKALQQFATGVRLEIRTNDGSLDSSWSINDLQELAIQGVRRVGLAVQTLNEIDDLGRWWQGRLRRKALLTAAMKLMTAPLRNFEFIVSATEMRLLEQAPWSHDDRLLSAFELAHSDIRSYAMDLEDQMQRQARSMFEAVAREDLIDGHCHATLEANTAARPAGNKRDSTTPSGVPAPVGRPSQTIDLS